MLPFFPALAFSLSFSPNSGEGSLLRGVKKADSRIGFPGLPVSQIEERGTHACTPTLGAEMVATLGMLFAVSRILWIIIVVVVVLVLVGFFVRGR
jgi:hypothetical protein